MEIDQQNLTKKERRAIKRQEKLLQRSQAARSGLINRYLLWTGVFLLFAAFIVGVVKLAPKFATNGGNASLTAAVNNSDWFKGGQNAAVTLVEYSDFQCPACARYAPLLRRLGEEYGDQIKIVYRHFPLYQIHNNATLAAQASEAAGRQGKFWEMHDLIFERQSEWAESGDAGEQFLTMAISLGLDSARFQTDIVSKDVKDKVQDNLLEGEKMRIAGTPTFFLNGRLINNPNGYEGFKNVIAKELDAR